MVGWSISVVQPTVIATVIAMHVVKSLCGGTVIIGC